MHEPHDRQRRFETLFREHVGAVTGYAMRRLSAGAAEDIVSETFLVAWRRLDDVPEDALPWLFSVARRALANAYRSRNRSAALASRLVDEVQSNVSDIADIAEGVLERRVMRQAFDSLRPDERELLMLVAWDGLSNERAASSLEITIEAFAVRLHRARRRLSEAVERLEPMTNAAESEKDPS